MKHCRWQYEAATATSCRCHEAFRKRNMKRSAPSHPHVPKAHFIGRSPASFFMRRRRASLKKALANASAFFWYRRRVSNPYDTHVSRDFKSLASADSATPASGEYVISLPRPFCQVACINLRRTVSLSRATDAKTSKVIRL